jgi:transcriptional regulator with GAF, ATPase, and Fis domain
MTATAAVNPTRETAADGAGRIPSAYDPGLVGIAPELFAPGKFSDTLNTVVARAQHTFGCDAASVILIADGTSYVAAAASTEEAGRADGFQIEHYEGPGLDAITEFQAVTATDLRLDSRWRFWAPLAAGLGFQSVLSLALTDDGPLGSLTLYYRSPSSFDAALLAAGRAFGHQVSVAIAVAVEREQLVRARDSRTVVGQATGVLMERHGVSADEAVAMLRRYSSHSNQKLRLIAGQVVSDRTLCELILRC